MNISSHVFFPLRWKVGRCRLDGSVQFPTQNSLTHYYPIDVTGRIVFLTPSDAVTLFGAVQAFYGANTYFSNVNLANALPDNCSILDDATNPNPSKPFTYILY